MKYLVVSDIHGSRSGAQCVPDCLARHGCDTVLLCGDVLYHGPRNDLPEDYAPKEVIAILNPLQEHIIAVRGNCDAEVDQMVLDFALTADYDILPLGSRRVFMSHGHVYGPDRLPKLKPSDIFLSGHTHIPTALEKDGIYLLNPGSVSLPKGGHPKTYGLLEEDGFTVFTMDHSEYMRIRF
jgi:putative phosphoesterase